MTKGQNMKIGIDVSQIVYGTGVSKYTKNLVTSLLRIDKKNEYVLFGGSLRRVGEIHKFHRTLRGSELKTFPVSPMIADFIWNKLHMFPIENFIGDVDVFHSSDWTQPPTRNAKKVTTIHDLVPILYPKESHWNVVRAHTKRLEWVKKEADRVIAVSHATKKDIVKYLGIADNKILVIHEAPDISVVKMGEVAIGKIRKKYNLPKEYLLAVGANPRKNLRRIIEAVGKLHGTPPLAVIGRKWDEYTLSKRSYSKDNVVWLGHIDDDVDFSTILSGASALIYASLYEGFGLPILDAYKCEVPVVTSNISSMPEVAGDAAVVVNPLEVDDITRGVEEALDKKDFLIKKGKARLKDFSWEKTAEQTLAVYESAISE